MTFPRSLKARRISFSDYKWIDRVASFLAHTGPVLDVTKAPIWKGYLVPLKREMIHVYHVLLTPKHLEDKQKMASRQHEMEKDILAAGKAACEDSLIKL